MATKYPSVFDFGGQNMATKLGIIGAGTMGRGIAEVGLLHGFFVTILDATAELSERGYGEIERSLRRGVEKGRVVPEKVGEMLARLRHGADYDLLKEADVVIEAVYEDLEVKKEVLSKVSRVVSPRALIGSNTSSLSITKMSEAVEYPERFLGIHFFNPVPVMRLVEVIRGERTSDDTVEKALTFARELGKTPIAVKESPGFVVNRLLCPMMNEAAFLVMERVASPEDIDTAMKLGANHPIGPLALADLVGIDVLYAIMNTLYLELDDPKYRPCPLLKEMIDRGHLGRKTGQGFFLYGENPKS